jgi:hypothetical protein
MRRVPIEAVEDFVHYPPPEVSVILLQRRAIHEDELLAEDPFGQQLLQLREEKDNFWDTIWLATSPQEIKELWKKVVDLLGDDQTALEKEALTSAAGR